MQEIEQAYHQYAILIVEGFYDILYDDDFFERIPDSQQGSLFLLHLFIIWQLIC